ncbi:MULTISPECIES: hypothetical protein [unclassified Stenotrophomonas]|uniref:hypothetical protein n=1 Tax=unclassified Stenotrophomonas TaxID=196198 RepID=UPI000D15C2B7|nr:MULTISPECIES: hypothetical protein [unclassified Stenotrophomonas]PTA70468.1 hypothetical protein C9412_16950 [Stenotrophomonas sp. Nf1]PTA77350.1 hypothetical protein C9416_15725 [Stenotrophomonas sp. Nf4]
MNRDEPLTPEERDLARLLGRRAEQAPPAALDAAILAAARAAVDAPAVDTAASPRTPRRRPRWPAVFGIAASMVFAIGIAWQLRPEPPPIPASEAAVAAAPAAADQTTESRAADAAMAPPEPAAAAPAAPQAAPMAAPAPAIARTARPAPAEATPAPAPAKAEAARARIAEPAADTSFAALPPPAPPAPPAPVAYSAPVPASAPAAAAAMKADSDAAPMASAASVEQAPALDRVEVTASKRAATTRSAPGVMRRSGNAGLSADAVQAEVNADARLPRRQWLQKIRERRDQGQRDLARASLERYVQQYPEARLPRDLRPLLDE